MELKGREFWNKESCCGHGRSTSGDSGALIADCISQVQTSSEDATDTRHHLAILKSEMSKLSPDLEIITNKMNITASYRNEKLYDPAITLSDILSEFPALRVGRIVS